MSDNIKKPVCNVMLAAQSRDVPQYGILGKAIEERGRVVGVDLNTTQTVCLVGRQGAGKSYSMGSLIEMFSVPIPGINHLPRPGCSLIFHYSQSQDYKPEWVSMGVANNVESETAALMKEYGGKPAGVKDLVIMTPAPLVELRKKEFPGIPVVPLLLHESEVTVDSYMNLMGDSETSSLEMQILLKLMAEHRFDLSPGVLIKAVDDHEFLTKEQKYLLRLKIELAQQYIGKNQKIIDVFVPGRVIIVDLRDEFLHKSMAFRLMLCILNVYQNAVDSEGKRFPKIVVFDEAHEYANDPFLVDAMVRMVRLMRHKALTILLASQDPMSLPARIIELASMVIMLAMETPEWVSYLAKCKTQIGKIRPEFFSELNAGEAYIWSRVSSDSSYTTAPQKCRIRTRATKHGGFTKVAVERDQGHS